MTSPFFSTDEIQKRISQLNFIKNNLQEPREPVTNRRRVSKKYQYIVDDYHDLLEKYNQLCENQKIEIEIIIETLSVLDNYTKKMDELENDKNDLANQLTETIKELQSEKNDHLDLISKLGISFKEMSLICNIVTQKSKVKDR